MPIITLITDMGTSGYYAGSVKAAILSGLPTANIVDITHHIRPFHISSAAFIIKNSYNQFPKGTTHIVSVDSLAGRNPRFLAIAHDGHYFVGPDNGLFSLAFDAQMDKVMQISISSELPAITFPARDVFAKVACYLANGGNIDAVGAICTDYQRPTPWKPTYDANSITAVVVYVDEYGNCICNLDKNLFTQIAKGRQFAIDVKGYAIETILTSYSQSPKGEIAAMFASSGMLELAINHGNLAELIGVKEGDMVKITFA